MPFSFIEIEERKKRAIFYLFIFLIFFYFFSAWLLAVVIRFISLPLETKSTKELLFLTPKSLLVIFIIAFAVAVLHWYISTSFGIKKIITIFKAHPPDKEDTYHRILQNIVDEVSIACGGRKIDCVILPVMAMNAFSIDDLESNAVIGVTEGLISRLSRPELEAVIAHEAAHIVSKDTLVKTIAVSVFGVYGAILEQLGKGMERSTYKSYGRRGGFHPYFLILYLVVAIIYLLEKLISMFISRECEYRADAVAVRLVRDPLSLAKGLHRISRGWRGGGMGYDTLECLFIINPNYNQLDESEGLIADLFSTHPPVKNRLDILLNMAHSDLGSLKKEAEAVKKLKYENVELAPLKESRWYMAGKGKEWDGPFSISELIGSGLLKFDTFIKKEGSGKINIVDNEPELVQALKQLDKIDGKYICPRCYQQLNKFLYEGAPVYLCSLCKGALLEGEKITRLLVRETQGFSEEVKREANIIEELAKKIFMDKRAKMKDDFFCPKCRKSLSRNFYSLVYPIEIDKCHECNLTWFDKNELEVLQYLVEKAQNNQNA